MKQWMMIAMLLVAVPAFAGRDVCFLRPAGGMLL